MAALCREERAVRDIVERMVSAAIDSPTARAQIEDEVLAFLRALEDRGLLMVRTRDRRRIAPDRRAPTR